MQLHMCLLECYVVAMQVPNSAGTLWLQEAMSYFSLGAGAPLDGGEFHQIPVFEEPSPAGPIASTCLHMSKQSSMRVQIWSSSTKRAPLGGKGNLKCFRLGGAF